VKRSQGFTLVEILLALVLMGMLLGLAYGGLRASTRAADKGQTILEESGRIRMAHQFVRKQLNQMAPLAFGVNESDGTRIVFDGSVQKIRFVSPMPGYLGFGGPQVQELALVSGEKGQMLVLTHALLQGFEEQNLYARDPIVLIENIDSAEFGFLGRNEDGELTTWVNQWDQPDILPVSVSLAVEFNEDVYLKWPLLTASVRVDSSALEDLIQNSGNEPTYQSIIQDMINKRSRRN
jgi:general secretion pathway protein J